MGPASESDHPSSHLAAPTVSCRRHGRWSEPSVVSWRGARPWGRGPVVGLDPDSITTLVRARPATVPSCTIPALRILVYASCEATDARP